MRIDGGLSAFRRLPEKLVSEKLVPSEKTHKLVCALTESA